MDINPVISCLYYCNVEYMRSPQLGSKEYLIPHHNQRVDAFGAIGDHICELHETVLYSKDFGREGRCKRAVVIISHDNQIILLAIVGV